MIVKLVLITDVQAYNTGTVQGSTVMCGISIVGGRP